MIGSGLFTFDPTDVVAEDAAILTVAIGVVSTDAAAVGATALPDPASELAYPWLYWNQLCIFAQSSVVSEWASSGAAIQRYEFDIKSQRKMAPSQSLVYFSELASTGAPTIQWEASAVRVLVLES